jgi:hypothetical protein
VAGLTRGTVAAASGLLFWLVVGAVVVRWYDRKGLYRLQPELLAHVNQAVQDYRAKQAKEAKQATQAKPAGPAPDDVTHPPDADSDPRRPHPEG